MSRKEIFLLFICLTHLTLVVLGAASVPAGRWVGWYGFLSGASRSFNFFAPEVGPSLRAQFDLYDSRGNYLATDSIQPSRSRESYLRVSNLVDMMPGYLEDSVLRKHVSASWAGKVLARHPNASRIILRLEQFDLPLMNEYASGLRYSWTPVFKITFNRRLYSHR